MALLIFVQQSRSIRVGLCVTLYFRSDLVDWLGWDWLRSKCAASENHLLVLSSRSSWRIHPSCSLVVLTIKRSSLFSSKELKLQSLTSSLFDYEMSTHLTKLSFTYRLAIGTESYWSLCGRYTFSFGKGYPELSSSQTWALICNTVNKKVAIKKLLYIYIYTCICINSIYKLSSPWLQTY